MTSTPDVPPFTGYVETTLHALRLIHAARQGVIPRITRRLNDAERRTMIKSGAVFVFSVDESGIKRWTDGLLWSPSRIVGNFLVYREINERTNSRGGHKKTYPLDSGPRCSTNRRTSPDQPTIAFKGPGHLSQGDHGTFKTNGLIKKTITVTIEGSDLHLISYYTSEDIRSGRLKKPTSRPDIMALSMPPHIFRLTNFRVPPKIEAGPDGKPRLVCEAEDPEPLAECKLEEPAYNVPGPAAWTAHPEPTHHTPRISTSYPSATAYNEPRSNVVSQTVYDREGTGDRWESLRIAPMPRPDIHDSWPSPTHPHGTLRRRDVSQGHTVGSSSWPAHHSHSARWRADSYASSSTGSGIHMDRPRGRSNSAYENANLGPYRRENEGNTRGAVSAAADINRGGGSPRSSLAAWLPRETSTDEKFPRSPHIGSSFTVGPSALPFSPPHNYPRVTSSFAAWSSSDGGDSVNATLHSIPHHTVAMSSYDSAYTPSDF